MSNKTVKKIWIVIVFLLICITTEIGIMYKSDTAILVGSGICLLTLLISLIFLFKSLKKRVAYLDTIYAKNLDDKPWQEYPRPQMVRNSYLNLNGYWDFQIKNNEIVPTSYSDKILVPFPIESKLSGICRRIKKGDYLFYHTTFTLTDDFMKDRILLHFQAVDQISKVYINNVLVYTNYGGYIPFEIDITEYIKDINDLVVLIVDDLDNKYPYGKQRVKNAGMWYTPVSGIWQTVWIESVPNNYIEKLLINPDIDNSKVDIEVIGKGCFNKEKRLYIIDYSGKRKEFIFKENKISIKVENAILWTPENPHLYNFEIEMENDKIESYFALRKISIGEYKDKKVIYLNNKPYFNNGLLDQGYYSDGIFLPASIDAYIHDLMKIKEMGFNTIRKHIKIEPLIWYSLCDKMGILVWQDMVNNSKYSFIKTTLLPTIGIKKINDDKAKINDINKEIFIKNVQKTVDLLYNVPSIILWTIFNEGWGQFESGRLFEIVKEIDCTRLVDSTSGWFDNGVSDLTSIHVYFKKIKIPFSIKPIVLSEFGGYAYKVKNHVYNLTDSYGYELYEDNNKYFSAIKNVYENEVIPNIELGLTAAIYTQLSDVEDEINGLLTYDRKVCKIDVEKMKEINKKVRFNNQEVENE